MTHLFAILRHLPSVKLLLEENRVLAAENTKLREQVETMKYLFDLEEHSSGTLVKRTRKEPT